MEQKKKPSEWFKELPPTIGRIATESIVEEFKDKKYNSLETALVSTFVWSSSPIGWEFWSKVNVSLHSKELLNQLEVEMLDFIKTQA
jgi:hypothetical protein